MSILTGQFSYVIRAASADTLRDLSHYRLIDFDLLRGLHPFPNFLNIGAEILLAPPRQHFRADHIERSLHFLRIDLLALFNRESKGFACNCNGSTYLP